MKNKQDSLIFHMRVLCLSAFDTNPLYEKTCAEKCSERDGLAPLYCVYNDYKSVQCKKGVYFR